MGEHEKDLVLVLLQHQLLDNLLYSQQHKLPCLLVALEHKQPLLVPHQYLAWLHWKKFNFLPAQRWNPAHQIQTTTALTQHFFSTCLIFPIFPSSAFEIQFRVHVKQIRSCFCVCRWEGPWSGSTTWSKSWQNRRQALVNLIANFIINYWRGIPREKSRVKNTRLLSVIQTAEFSKRGRWTVDWLMQHQTLVTRVKWSLTKTTLSAARPAFELSWDDCWTRYFLIKIHVTICKWATLLKKLMNQVRLNW